MLDIKIIREHIEKVRKSIKDRGLVLDLDRLLSLDGQRRKKIQEIETLKAGQNKLGKENREEAQALKQQIKALEPELEQLEVQYSELLWKIPNIPTDDVPVGKDERDNKIIRSWGTPPKFDFKPKDHLALGEALDLIDVETAAKTSGTRFAFLKREAVLLEFALVRYAFDVLTSEKILKKIAQKIDKNYSAKPFVPVVPPVMIRPEIFRKMARLSEDDKNERYYIPQDDLYLVGSAEHTLGPMHMDEVLEEKNLPLRYVGFSTSFRRESGSYGKDTRGILRVHQFDKLEMESFVRPEDSVQEHNFLVAIQEYFMQSLGIPYQVVFICTGDMGAPDARQIDIECWMPGQGKYRETHTADFMADYQARRLNTRVRRKGGELEYAHMVDATTFAMSRTPIAILENYQQKDGSIKIPKVLQKYAGISVIPHGRNT
ncbi:MAG: serine--tRNA ligase [Parcubacteria group bacterium]|nr:serine--tRNA ligase [Parcubacteria group bacterium]